MGKQINYWLNHEEFVKKIAPYTEVTDHIISKHDIFQEEEWKHKEYTFNENRYSVKVKQSCCEEVSSLEGGKSSGMRKKSKGGLQGKEGCRLYIVNIKYN